jgi:hypothetical protein
MEHYAQTTEQDLADAAKESLLKDTETGVLKEVLNIAEKTVNEQ